MHLHPGHTWTIKECADTHSVVPPSPASLSASQVYTLDQVCVFCWVLTHYIQGVRVVDGSKLIFHQAGVVALVWWHHTLHDEGPMLVTDLGVKNADFFLGALEPNADLRDVWVQLTMFYWYIIEKILLNSTWNLQVWVQQQCLHLNWNCTHCL